jgi:hypothetical protein
MDESPHLILGYQLRRKSQLQVQEGWSPTYELRGPLYEELTICMAEWEGLTLVTLARDASKGCDTLPPIEGHFTHEPRAVLTKL